MQTGQPGIADDATIGFDADGRVASVSVAAANALGYQRAEEIEGVSLAALIGEQEAAKLIHQSTVRDPGLNGVASEDLLAHTAAEPVTFVRRDGSRINLNTVLTPDTAGGWITILDSGSVRSASGQSSITSGTSGALIDVAGILRTLAEQTGKIGDVTEITSRFAAELRIATDASAVTVARSSAIAGIYEPIARVSEPGATSLTETIDLPPALVPQQGAGPIAVDSLENLALFEPVILYGEEFTGSYVAARADLHDGAHLLVIATRECADAWADAAVLLMEAGVLTLAGTLRATELERRIATYSRASETVRQIGALASRDHDGGFLDAARKIIGRRLPVSAISIHVADQVTGRCYVPDASSTGNEEFGALAPGVEWPLVGSIEQRVLKTGSAVFTSATSSERLSVPPATITHWRRSGLQAVVALPLREAGEVVAIMLAGFSSPVSDPKEVIRLLESIAPAVHLGVGLSAGRAPVVSQPDEAEEEPGFISPRVLLAITKSAADSPDSATLFASVTEWLIEVIPSAEVAWGTVDRTAATYHRQYHYDSTATARIVDEAVPVSDDLLQVLDMAGLGLGEPGTSDSPAPSMRAPVIADQKVIAIATVWPREGDAFSSVNLARLQKVCEFIGGPLARILEADDARKSQRTRDGIADLATLAAEFPDAQQALRSLRSQLAKLIPHDRTVFLELDPYEDTARTAYDSAKLPIDNEGSVVQTSDLSPLELHELAESGRPAHIQLSSKSSRRSELFTGCSSLLAIPVPCADGPSRAMLLLSEQANAFTDAHISLAAELSTRLRSAVSSWQSYSQMRESRHRMIDLQKHLSLVLDNTPVALITTDVDGVCNAIEGHGLETLGIKREDIHNRPIFEWTSRFPELEEAIRLAMRGEMANALTSLGSHSVEIWTQPLTATDGSIKGVSIVGYDVSDRARSQRATAEKRELQEMLRNRIDIIESASHDLRNQLQSIISYAEVLSADVEERLNPSQKHGVNVILKTAETLDEMLGDLPELDYKLTVSQVDANSLMREIVDSHQQIFVSKGQTLVLGLPDRAYRLQADRMRITQVVTNLLSNASKYSPKGAEVAINIDQGDGNLHISVTDNGPGIPGDQLERVWDTGIRLANPATSKVEGSGLGLAIVRKITEMHGGTARIESTVGVGTTVTVVLPGATPVNKDDEAERPPLLRIVKAKAKPEAPRPKRRRRRSGTG